MPLDLLSPTTVASLRRVAARAAHGARHAAYALETCNGDEDAAAAALMDETRIASAQSSLDYVRRAPGSAAYIPRWEEVVRDRTHLLASRPPAFELPPDMTTWIHHRLRLTQAPAPPGLTERVGALPGVLGFAVPIDRGDDANLANRLALANDAFPIEDDWMPVTAETAEAELAYVLGHDLAYRIERWSRETAAAEARRFVSHCGRDATFFTNSDPIIPSPERRGRGSSPLTLATMDWGVVALGERCGVCVLSGED